MKKLIIISCQKEIQTIYIDTYCYPPERIYVKDYSLVDQLEYVKDTMFVFTYVYCGKTNQLRYEYKRKPSECKWIGPLQITMQKTYPCQ